jgi:hypothetical protein
MGDMIESIFADWSLPPALTIVVVLGGFVYLRGWLAIRKTRAAQFTRLRLIFFLAGLAVLWVAIASPLDGFADVSLSAHMVQHLLLMSAVPPLLLLGWPVVPRGVDGHEHDLRGVAHPRGLRRGAQTRTLARMRAHVFSRELARVLVVHHQAMADR